MSMEQANQFFSEALTSNDNNKARELYEKAIELGHAGAAFHLALMYHNGEIGDGPDTEVARFLYEKAVELGDAGAAFNLALMYHKGEIGDGPDTEMARFLYEKAVELGDAGAAFNLAFMYHNGEIGDGFDKEKARFLYEKVVELGDASAAFNLAWMYDNGEIGDGPDKEKARLLYEKAVGLKNPRAAFNLALMYKRGEIGGNPDIEKARSFYEKAIDFGHASAAFNLAWMYKRGEIGGTPEIDKARSFYEKAVELGDPDAAFNLALMYDNGEIGDEPDKDKARSFYEKAIGLGHASAAFNLAEMYRRGEFGVAPDKDKARTFYEKALDLGDAYAAFNLALMYDKGEIGDGPDKEKARPLYEKAASLGNSKAKLYVEIFSITANDDVQRALRKILNLQNALLKDRNQFLQDPNQSNIELAHFTDLKTVASMLTTINGQMFNGLRLYHAVYMNDPGEGRRLIPKENCFEDANAWSASQMLKTIFDEVYFNDFDPEKKAVTSELPPSVFMVSLTKEIDRLDLWRAYGRDGSGCSIVIPITQENIDFFKHDDYKSQGITAFAEKAKAEGRESEQLVKSQNPLRLPLYEVKYKNEDVENLLKDLHEPLSTIAQALQDQPDTVKKSVHRFIAKVLIEVLFLFKDEEYSSEREVRSLMIYPIDDVSVLPDEREPRHLFCRSPNFLFEHPHSAVIVGPKVIRPEKAIWDIRHRLVAFRKVTGKRVDENTSVYLSKVRYR